jgi:hypothetical protein
MKEKVWVKALVDPKLHTKVPGVGIVLWGHAFQTQSDGSLCMEMDIDFVKPEVRAGRIRVLEKPPPGKSNEAMISKIVVIKEPVVEKKPVEKKPAFTHDIGDFFGAGSLNDLIDQIGQYTKSELIEFADERFKGHEISKTMKNDMIIDKIRSLTDIAYMQYTEEKSLEDND